MNAADRPPIKITGNDSKKVSNTIWNYVGFHSLFLNSKGIQMNAADKPSLILTGNESKKDSKGI